MSLRPLSLKYRFYQFHWGTMARLVSQPSFEVQQRNLASYLVAELPGNAINVFNLSRAISLSAISVSSQRALQEG